MSPPIRFYVPRSAHGATELPSSVAGYWPWISAQPQIDSWGAFSWTLQTCLYLQADGFPVELTQSLPDEGIVVAHRDYFPTELVPGPKLLLACILADREEPGLIGRHPYAQVHIVQNPRDPMLRRFSLWRAHYMPYWPQPNLIPRDPGRGERFDSAAFFGYSQNLAPELQDPAWEADLCELGLGWRIIPREQWHDYSGVDVVVAVRSFGTANSYTYKPPSKLHNAWCAGVPAVLGPEAAYRYTRRSELDYLEVDSRQAALDALRRLRDDRALRRAILENGRRRAEEVRPERLVQRWRSLLGNELITAQRRWSAAPRVVRSAFVTLRSRSYSRLMARRSGG